MLIQLPTVQGRTESGLFVDEELASVALRSHLINRRRPRKSNLWWLARSE
jgi:hypothetical protein